MKVAFSVNGTNRTADISPTEMLVDVLRNKLSEVGTHKVCAQGICGACTVLLDGEPVTSCLTLAAQVDGRCVTTVEGLEDDNGLAPIQEAFMRHGAVQCGYCTPGFLMVAHALVKDHPHASREEIIDALRGNICRCTGYVKIIDAVADVVQKAAVAKGGL
ncbi:MAG: (2Fe-2S)-binding protein [Chelatococcus sp.]|uniref:(2Fe-2S)-binding protein n=1 Tax=Chelatococcus sp. TaxID=1953771 RepID=UPI0025C02C15|nr:(2Fe-2S)-binding protein [Chelatococcus sp.]MBX3538935.1 (2Fe-2S)-binding protein [Chelatococcus sp.]